MKSRNTLQKELIQQEIDSYNGFFNAQELLEKVQIKNKHVGIATIYRYLKDAVQRNELHSYLCKNKTIYSTKQRSHCHFTCTKTGKSFHFEIKNLDFLEGVVPGEIESIQLEVKGECRGGCH